MKTYLVDLLPRLRRFSQKLDDLTRLTNQHWVVLDELSNSKVVYIFRANNNLLISQDGKVEKANWEYLGNNSILIDKKEDSFLFKHGFLDENVLALKVDSKDEYAILVNESKYEEELNSLDKVVDFLKRKYLDTQIMNIRKELQNISDKQEVSTEVIKENEVNETLVQTKMGLLKIQSKLKVGYTIGDLVFLNGKLAPNGKYVYGWPSWVSYIKVKDGKLNDF